jgi:hypothetical protein
MPVPEFASIAILNGNKSNSGNRGNVRMTIIGMLGHPSLSLAVFQQEVADGLRIRVIVSAFPDAPLPQAGERGCASRSLNAI